MKFTKGHAKLGGRRKGSPNRRTEKERLLITEADDIAIVAKIVAETKAGNLTAANIYFKHLRPPSPRSWKTGASVDLPPPRTAQEACDQLARITALRAKEEIGHDLAQDVIAGLSKFLEALKASELEAKVAAIEARNGDGANGAPVVLNLTHAEIENRIIDLKAAARSSDR